MQRRIGLFGGSFNPIHFGHLIVARAVRERLALDEVVFLPSRQPPHKLETDLIEAHHRAEMVRRAIEGEPEFAFSDLELSREGPCYTFDTVSHLQRQAQAEYFWIIGRDSLAELPTWHRAGELVRSCTIVTAARSGAAVDWNALETAFSTELAQKLRDAMISTPIIEISSTEIRKRVREGRSIRFLVPEVVRAYIMEHDLYQ